jgi:hypothetical protein
VTEVKEAGFLKQLLLFAAKTAVVLIALLVLADSVYVELKGSKALRQEQTKLYILGLIQNPAALYKASEAEERAGKLKNAIRDMELAIGLLEKHNADKQVLTRYYGRLEKLVAQKPPAK